MDINQIFVYLHLNFGGWIYLAFLVLFMLYIGVSTTSKKQELLPATTTETNLIDLAIQENWSADTLERAKERLHEKRMELKRLRNLKDCKKSQVVFDMAIDDFRLI